MVSDRLHIGLWLYRCCHDHLENEPADRARQLCTTQKAHQEHDARLPVRFTSSNRIVLATWTQPSKHGYNHCARCLQHWLRGPNSEPKHLIRWPCKSFGRCANAAVSETGWSNCARDNYNCRSRKWKYDRLVGLYVDKLAARDWNFKPLPTKCSSHLPLPWHHDKDPSPV